MRIFKYSFMGLLGTMFMNFSACDKNNNDTPHPVSLESLSGLVQKGPFMNGTAINIAELNGNLGQTGLNFTTEITDNLGSFRVENLELSAQFVELSADGFYFNEVAGDPSNARLVLSALSDLSDKSTLNVNLLSHLEVKRIYQLYSEGFSFSDAKSQAQREVLSLFHLEQSDMQESELLDITGSGDEHAILLAISVILQGHRSVAQLSELLADLGTDLRKDGELSDQSSGSELINHTLSLNLPLIRESLETRYEEIGLEVTLPDFEKYVQYFIENCEYEVTRIEYPEFGTYGENILFGDKASFILFEKYSMAADLPAGAHLTVRLSGGRWGIGAGSNSSPINWSVSENDLTNLTQTFTSINPGEYCDLRISFIPVIEKKNSSIIEESDYEERVLVEYFENLSDTATRSKWITFERE